MTSTDFGNRGFIFSVRFKDIYGKEAEIVEKKEYEARKLQTILRRKTDARLYIHYSDNYSKQIA